MNTAPHKLDDIAAMIAGKTSSSDQDSGSSGDTDADLDLFADGSLHEEEDGTLLASDLADDVNNEEEEEDSTPLEGELENDEDDEQETKTDDRPYLDVTDEDLIEVKIDGEVVYRTLGEAKKALSGEGAIDKRLKEVTTLRNDLYRQQQSGVSELEESRQQLFNVLQHLDSVLFAPTVPKPNDQLRLSDPKAYLGQLDLYNAEVARIGQARAQLKQNLQQQAQERQRNQQIMRQRTEQELLNRIPELKVQENQPKVMQSIVDIAAEYGFSQQEMAQFFDARAYQMAYDLAKMRTGKKAVVTKVTKEEQNTTRVPRRLRSGVAVKAAQDAAKRKVREQARKRAQSTGKVDDVVATILKPAQRR